MLLNVYCAADMSLTSVWLNFLYLSQTMVRLLETHRKTFYLLVRSVLLTPLAYTIVSAVIVKGPSRHSVASRVPVMGSQMKRSLGPVSYLQVLER